MSKGKKKISESIKSYHLILLSCLLCIIFLLNSKNVNKQRASAKLSKEQDEFFLNLIYPRKLQMSSEDYANQVCSKASKDLKEYYQTGDPDIIKLDTNIESKDKDKKYMQALISIVNGFLDDDDDDEDSESEGNQKYMDYAQRFFPLMFFLGLSVLSIIGWIVCCFCCCCNCCCCCCCKKEGCKKICFGITYFFYVAVVGVCIYGLASSSKITQGMRNTGCSFLQFLKQALDGEIRQEPPYWAGVRTIDNTINGLKTFIENQGRSAHLTLNQSMINLINREEEFLSYMNQSGFDLEENIADYSKDYSDAGISGYPLKDKYTLDIVKTFGKKNQNNDEYTENSILGGWKQEYSLVAGNARGYLDTANEAFNDILDQNLEDVIDNLDSGTNILGDVIEPFENAYNDLGEILIDVNDIMDEYSKMAFSSIFSALMILNIDLGVFMALTCLCSMKQCTSCCCCRCIFKCCIHLSWNCLSLMMIFSFLIGSLLGIIGTLGGDVMSFISYILSRENLYSEDPILLNKIGNVTDYLKTLLYEDGDISQNLNLGDESLGHFQDINIVQNQINNIKQNFTIIRSQCFTYNATIKSLKDKTELNEDINLIPNNSYNNERNKISYFDFIEKINSGFTNEDNKYSWKFSSIETRCDINLGTNTIFNPKNCKPKIIIDEKLHLTNDLKKYAYILDDIDTFLSNANKIYNTGKPRSFKEILDSLKDKYVNYLSGYITALDNFGLIIEKFMESITPLIGDGNNFFSFMNGKFIGVNLRIILKYLKNAIGKDIYTIGVLLIVSGCVLICSIFCTLLLLAIINDELKKHINIENNPALNSASNQGMSVSQFKLNRPIQLEAPKV